MNINDKYFTELTLSEEEMIAGGFSFKKLWRGTKKVGKKIARGTKSVVRSKPFKTGAVIGLFILGALFSGSGDHDPNARSPFHN